MKFLVDKLNEMTGLNPFMCQIIVLVIVIIIVLVILMLIKGSFMSILNSKKNDPFLLKGSKNAKNSLIIPQNPKEEGSITLYRSDNEDGGMEFTYTFWMLIDNLSYKHGQWKHVFHKGNDTGYPLRAPGVYLHPTKNLMRFYMNTHDDILDYVDVDNIPLRKWMCVGIVLKQKDLDIYINGSLKTRKTFAGLPRQNFGDVWINLFGGFEGYMSELRYHRKALEGHELDSIVSGGPSKGVCGDTGEMPPYLDDDWWYQRDN